MRSARLPRAAHLGPWPHRSARHLDHHPAHRLLNVPGVGQDFVIERHTEEKETGEASTENVHGVTSRTPQTATGAAVLAFNRGHWSVENGCRYALDWNSDEDRCTIRAIKAKSRDAVAATIQRLARNVRLVFDHLHMTQNSRRRPRPFPAPAG